MATMFMENQPEWDGSPTAPVREHTDLRQAVGEETLAHLALDAVQRLDDVRPAWRRHASHAFEPRMMLTLLSYCYASGIYGSAQVADAIRDNRMIRYLCARTYPDPKAIRSFRKGHRGLLHQCLNHVLQQARGWHPDPALADSYGGSVLTHRLCGRIDADAQHRLDVAIFIDRMLIDED